MLMKRGFIFYMINQKAHRITGDIIAQNYLLCKSV
jgi:hypothetical protein